VLKYKIGCRITLWPKDTFDYFWSKSLTDAIQGDAVFERVPAPFDRSNFRIRYNYETWTIVPENYIITVVEDYELPEELFQI